MYNLTQFLTFEYEKEYVFEYDLPLKKNYSTTKICIFYGDLCEC